MMRYDGPLQGGGFDFEGWNWGDLGDLVEPLTTRIAEVIGEQFRTDMKLDDPPRLDVDMDGDSAGADNGLVIAVTLFGDGFLIIPLADIVIDGDLSLLSRDKASIEVDWNRSLAVLRAGLATLDGWRDEIKRQLVETIETMQRKETGHAI